MDGRPSWASLMGVARMGVARPGKTRMREAPACAQTQRAGRETGPWRKSGGQRMMQRPYLPPPCIRPPSVAQRSRNSSGDWARRRTPEEEIGAGAAAP